MHSQFTAAYILSLVFECDLEPDECRFGQNMEFSFSKQFHEHTRMYIGIYSANHYPRHSGTLLSIRYRRVGIGSKTCPDRSLTNG